MVIRYRSNYVIYARVSIASDERVSHYDNLMIVKAERNKGFHVNFPQHHSAIERISRGKPAIIGGG